MKRRLGVLVVLLLLVLLVPLVTSTVNAFNKNGPTPIPGDLIPFPGHKHVHHPAVPAGKSG